MKNAFCRSGGFALLPRTVVWMAAVGLMIPGADAVFGQTTSTGSGQAYPARPIRILTAAIGSGNDLVARLIAQGSSLGQQVIVENRGVIAIEIVAKAPPDGHTLLLYGTPLWLTQFMRDDVAWDPVRDFLPITWATIAPNILVVHPSLPVKSVKELIALAKARPGELDYGSGSVGSVSHFAAELFKSMAGVNIVRISYKGAGPALIALLAGESQVLFPSATAGMPHVKAGRVRGLAVCSLGPSALTPGLPTVAASGLPGYQSASILGIFAPAGTSATIINRLNQEIVRVLKRADVKEKLFSSGVEVVASSPEQLAATVKSEMATAGKVIKDAGIRDESRAD